MDPRGLGRRSRSDSRRTSYARAGRTIKKTAIARANAAAEQFCRLNSQRAKNSFLSTGRWRQSTLTSFLSPAPPDIAVDIISPSESSINVHRKTAEYLKSGVGKFGYWMSLTRRSLFNQTPPCAFCERADLLQSDLLPGFSVPVSDVLSQANRLAIAPKQVGLPALI